MNPNMTMETVPLSQYPKFLISRKTGRLYMLVRKSTMEKAHRDLSKLTKKVIIDKNGHKKTVYVRMQIPEKGDLSFEKKVAVIERQSTISETDAERNLSFDELRKACLVYAQKNLQGKSFTNRKTGRVIQVSHQGLGEWKMKSKTREQVLSIKILDKILEDADFDHDAPDQEGRVDIEMFSYFKRLCNINGTLFQAIITIKRTMPYGDKYYHHYLEDIKIEPRSGTAPTLSD
jgi:hypothetical protein